MIFRTHGLRLSMCVMKACRFMRTLSTATRGEHHRIGPLHNLLQIRETFQGQRITLHARHRQRSNHLLAKANNNALPLVFQHSPTNLNLPGIAHMVKKYGNKGLKENSYTVSHQSRLSRGTGRESLPPAWQLLLNTRQGQAAHAIGRARSEAHAS